VQPIAQPACDDTHTVARSSLSISTVSTCAPSCARHSHLVVPSVLICVVTGSSASGSASASRNRSSIGSVVISSSGVRCVHNPSISWSTR
jgi:hypothetical protein